MNEVRPAAVAGMFYPGSRESLQAMIQEYLREAVVPDLAYSPKAVIAPHAGLVYSGPIAGSAFRCFSAEAREIRRVILLGPAHRMAVEGVALPGQEAFETPMGIVPVDQELVERISDLPQVTSNRAAHAPEHCLEVELPFLQEVLGDFSVLPMLVSRIDRESLAEVLDRVWGGSETRIVVSSDLSHYLSYEAAQRLDWETAQKVVGFGEPIDEHRACGAVAINGFLTTARRRELAPRLLDLRSSGDTAGDRRRVVGYGSFAFAEAS